MDLILPFANCCHKVQGVLISDSDAVGKICVISFDEKQNIEIESAIEISPRDSNSTLFHSSS